MLTPTQWHTRFVAQARWTATLREYLFKQLDLSSASRLLEVGCGTGAILGEASSANPNPKSTIRDSQSPCLHGLDIDPLSLRLCAQHVPAARLAQGDAHHLPYAPASFEAVFCHFLLLWVHDPVRVVSEMRRVARPGAPVMAFAEPDYGGRIDYPPELAQLGRWQRDALQRQGADPTIGRKLAAIFQQAGLADIQTGVLGGEWRMDDPVDDSEWQVLQDDLRGLVSPEEVAELHQQDMTARDKGERILYVPTFYAVGYTN